MLLFLSLSAADQELWLLPHIALGAVNRSTDVRRCVGGKAVNAARAAALLGGECIVLGFFGREGGLVERLEAEGIRADPIYTECATRSATTIVDCGRREVTELVEEAHLPTAAECAALRERFLVRAREADVICMCGSLPRGLKEDIYGELIRRTGHRRVIVDAQGGVLRAAVAAGPLLVKPNRRELAGLSRGGTTASLSDVAAQARELRRLGAAHVAVSCGAEGVVLVDENAVVYRPPRVEVVNTTGCGDAVTGGVAYGLAAGLDVREAVRLGVACGTASAGDPMPAKFDRRAMEGIRARIVTEDF